MKGAGVDTTDDKLDRGTILALVAMALGVFVIANDFTALSVAIPEIEQDLGTDLTTAQWVINGYALVFGVLIVTGGRLADLFGRKRIFMIGSAIFADVLGARRARRRTSRCSSRAARVMGIGGAMMWPAVLGMTYALVPDAKAGLAGGLILGVAGFGNAVGPMFGGLLTDELSWRWVFFVNLPIALFAMFVTQREVTETQVDADRPPTRLPRRRDAHARRRGAAARARRRDRSRLRRARRSSALFGCRGGHARRVRGGRVHARAITRWCRATCSATGSSPRRTSRCC